MARLQDQYKAEIVPKLKEKFGYRNVMQVPRLSKIVVNMGLGEAIENVKVLETAAEEIAPSPARSRWSPGAQEHRELQAARGHAHRRHGHAAAGPDVPVPRQARSRSPFRACATSRGFPRGRSTAAATTPSGSRSRSSSPRSNYDKIDKIRGMNITIVTTARTDEEGLELLRLWECPSGRKQERRATLAKKSIIAKSKRTPKFAVRKYNRCPRCGRPRAFYRKFQLCRICLRQLALRGELPGVIKASW